MLIANKNLRWLIYKKKLWALSCLINPSAILLPFLYQLSITQGQYSFLYSVLLFLSKSKREKNCLNGKYQNFQALATFVN